MRICLLAHVSSIHTRRWARYLSSKGHEVTIVSLTPGPHLPSVDLRVLRRRGPVRYDKTNWEYLLDLPRIWRLVRRPKPDVINAHFLSSNGFFGALVCPSTCALVISVHGSDVLVIPRRSAVHRWVARFALSRADLITSPAYHLTEEVERLSSSARPVVTGQYGVLTEVFHPPSPDEKRQPVILSARALVRMANIATILEAVRRLEPKGLPLTLHVVGDGPERPRLESSAQDLTGRRRARFLGFLQQGDLAERMRSSALYVSMTSSDGASMTLLEAMACGTFPVVSDIPANREWIIDGENGFLVPLGSPGELAERLEAAWRNAELRLRAAERNWQIVREKADFENNMAVIEGMFRRLVRNKGNGRRLDRKA